MFLKKQKKDYINIQVESPLSGSQLKMLFSVVVPVIRAFLKSHGIEMYKYRNYAVPEDDNESSR